MSKPELFTPPPEEPKLPVAELSLTVQRVSVANPEFHRPPP